MYETHRVSCIVHLTLFFSNLKTGRSDIKETAFWRSYFCQCEQVRMEHLAPKAEVVNLSDSGASLGSLLVVDDKGDDSSYEYLKKSIASPPSSANTDYSFGDMVLVRAESRELQELDDCAEAKSS
jgi:hypothetical protein